MEQANNSMGELISLTLLTSSRNKEGCPCIRGGCFSFCDEVPHVRFIAWAQAVVTNATKLLPIARADEFGTRHINNVPASK